MVSSIAGNRKKSIKKHYILRHTISETQHIVLGGGRYNPWNFFVNFEQMISHLKEFQKFTAILYTESKMIFTKMEKKDEKK